VVFFYGILIGIAVWEVKKSADASEKLRAELKAVGTTGKES
jgi:hypothetical protein